MDNSSVAFSVDFNSTIGRVFAGVDSNKGLQTTNSRTWQVQYVAWKN